MLKRPLSMALLQGELRRAIRILTYAGKRHKRGKEIAAIKCSLALGVPIDVLLLTTDECLSNFRNHNPLFLDIAWEGIVLKDSNNFLSSLIEETKRYIAERRLEKLPDGWTFSVPERESVALSKVSNKDFSSAMITDGKRDLAVGVKIFEDGFYDKAVYHFQQSVEKAVKAVLMCFGMFKKTHFVGEILRGELEKRDLDAGWKKKLMQVASTSSEVEPEVTWSRYPGVDGDALWIPAEQYTVDDAREIKEKAALAVQTADVFLRWWFRL